MTYEDLIARALKGRSVSSLATAFGMQKMTLNRYVKGTQVPDYRTAGLIAREANVGLAEVMTILIRKEEELKGTKEVFAAGFRFLTNALNRLFTRVYAV